ncbi:hypothetical protein Rs2_35341 [Raphanus sativus]|nr:hypothetical protein Rs2_35341 [Raphanus sativus]
MEGRNALPMIETALKADVCRKAASWALKWEVMHDPWVYMIRLDRGVQWRSMPDMIKKAQDLVRSSIRDTRPSGKGRIIVELIHPCGMAVAERHEEEQDCSGSLGHGSMAG